MWKIYEQNNGHELYWSGWKDIDVDLDMVDMPNEMITFFADEKKIRKKPQKCAYTYNFDD